MRNQTAVFTLWHNNLSFKFHQELFTSRDRERDRKREPVFCGSLNSLRTQVLGFQKLRNQ